MPDVVMDISRNALALFKSRVCFVDLLVFGDLLTKTPLLERLYRCGRKRLIELVLGLQGIVV